MSKIIEKVVASSLSICQPMNYLRHYNLHTKKYHGTETALVRVQNDILCSLDKKCGVFLVLLDLSAAFDIIDRGILHHRLESIGVKSRPLEWICLTTENNLQ